MKNKEINKTIFYLDSWDGEIHCPKCGTCLIPQGKEGDDEVWVCLHCNIEVDKTVIQLTFRDKLDFLTTKWYIRIPTAIALFSLAVIAMTQGSSNYIETILNYTEMILFTILGFDVLLLWK